MDNLTSAQRHRNMKNIKSHDTGIETKLRKALREKGYGYRKNYKALPGRPDIVLTKYKIAIFCDSEFFHGKDWTLLEPRLRNGTNSEYWIKKIQGNMNRDEQINTQLMHLGWKVLRFWGKEIEKAPEECVREIEDAIVERLSENSY